MLLINLVSKFYQQGIFYSKFKYLFQLWASRSTPYSIETPVFDRNTIGGYISCSCSCLGVWLILPRELLEYVSWCYWHRTSTGIGMNSPLMSIDFCEKFGSSFITLNHSETFGSNSKLLDPPESFGSSFKLWILQKLLDPVQNFWIIQKLLDHPETFGSSKNSLDPKIWD